MKLYEEFREFETMWEAVGADNTPRGAYLYAPRTNPDRAALQRKVAQLEGIKRFEVSILETMPAFINAAREYMDGRSDLKAYTDQAGMDAIAAKIQDSQLLKSITVVTL